MQTLGCQTKVIGQNIMSIKPEYFQVSTSIAEIDMPSHISMQRHFNTTTIYALLPDDMHEIKDISATTFELWHLNMLIPQESK